MAKLTLSDITSGYLSADAYNANNALIEAAFENTLSRDGTVPNGMASDLDMDSFDINNLTDINMSGDIVGAGTINTTSLIVNGVVLIPTEDAAVTAAAPDATQVSFTPTNPAGPLTILQDALDDDYMRNDRNESLTGTFTASGLVTANSGITSVGNVGVTGNITVSGTVDGRDIAADGVVLDAVPTPADIVQKPTQATNHIRAGNLQLTQGGVSIDSYDVKNNVTINTWETFGPTGSGADNIYAEMDIIPAGATMVVMLLDASFFATGISYEFLEVQVAHGDVADPLSYFGNVVAVNHVGDGDATHDEKGALGTNIIIPINSSRVFKLKYNGVTPTFMSLVYHGFMTD